MSYLKQLTDADKAMRTAGAGPCMHIHVGYSLAAEVAKLADLGKAVSDAPPLDENMLAQAVDLLRDDVVNWPYPDQRHAGIDELQHAIDAHLGCRSGVTKVEPEPVFLVWTDADSRAAAAEGWDVFAVSGMVDRNHLAIQRLDEAGRFGSDEEAIWHVYTEAVRERSALHRKAMAVTLAETNGR